MARQSRLPRWCHQLYAYVMGYFWIPCPICRRPFGGHEWAATLYTSQFTGRGVCQSCVGAAQHYNRINGYDYRAYGTYRVVNPDCPR